MTRPMIDRLSSAFKSYTSCVAGEANALVERSQVLHWLRGPGPHFGILVDNDKYAKRYRECARRAEIIEEWVWQHFPND